MAKQRMLNTKFWSDGFIRQLKPEEKLFYLYLLSNQYTDICGVYEIDMETMAFESGLSMDRISKTIDRLSHARKVLYSDGWIYLKNWKKHQLSNPKVQKGIEIGLCKVPPEFLAKIKEFDRLSIDYHSLSHSNSNPNSNPNSNSERGEASSPTPKQSMTEFLQAHQDNSLPYQEFVSILATKYNTDENKISAELDKFVNYWTELNASGTKQRWQLQKVFEVQKRIVTWFSNINKRQAFNSNQQGPVIVR